jgi:hypothetical protein
MRPLPEIQADIGPHKSRVKLTRHGRDLKFLFPQHSIE